MSTTTHMKAVCGGLAVAGLMVAGMVFPAHAQEFGNDYWGPVDTSSQSALIDSVHELLRTTHNRIPYTGTNWPILEAADEHPEVPGSVLDIYKNSTIPFDSPRPYDREHVWPQSRGFPEGGTWSLNARADLHNLYISDRPYNNARGNYTFDYVPGSTDEFPTDVNLGVGGGSGVYPGNSNWRDNATQRWEVWHGSRGNAARAYLYMAVRYNGGTGADGSLEPDLRITDNTSLFATGAQAVAYHGMRSVILEWHEQDPPDDRERFRHDVVAEAQLNRNPFIDYPEWADCIFEGDCSAIAPIHPQGLFATPDAGSIILNWDARIESDLAGYNVHRAVEGTDDYSIVNPSLLLATTFTDTTAPDGVLFSYAVTAVDADGNESLFSQPAVAATGSRSLIAQETFETTDNWTLDGGTGDFGNAFFGRWSLSPNTVPSQLVTATTGVVGNFFIGGANTSGTPTQQSDPTFPLPANGIHTLSLNPIDVSSYTNLRVEIALNARNADEYDSIGQANGDYLQVLVSLDGNDDVLIGQFTRVGTSPGSNGKFGIDLNLNGLGDIEIQDYSRLEDYEFDVPPGTASSLVVRIRTRFDANNEEIVYDNVRVTGIELSDSTSTDVWALY